MPALPPLPWSVLLAVLPVAVPPELVSPPEVPSVFEVPPVFEAPLLPEDPVVLAVLFDESDSELEQAVSTAKIETEKAKAEARRTSRSKVCMARSIPHFVTRCDQGASPEAFHLGRCFAVVDQAVAFEPTQGERQHALRDAFDGSFDLAETLRSVAEQADDEDAPLVANAAEHLARREAVSMEYGAVTQ